MRKKPDNKLVKAMMMGALGFMLLCSFKVSAAETVIVKCTAPQGNVAYQDFACADDQIMEVLKVEGQA